MTSELGRDPTSVEVAKAMGWSEGKLLKFERSLDLLLIQRGTSLDAPIGCNDDGDGRAVIDMLTDEECASTVDTLIVTEDEQRIRAAIERLPAREADVLRRRFGFDGRDEEGLREIGESYGLSRERIRQLELIALSRLRDEIARTEGRWPGSRELGGIRDAS